jgi:hypothetical protein
VLESSGEVVGDFAGVFAEAEAPGVVEGCVCERAEGGDGD